MESLKRYQYCLSNITTSEGACSNPQITWAEKPGVFISCTGTCITVSFSEDYTGERCVKLFIQCDTCYACEPLERDICFCSNSEHCGPCETCNSEGLCVTRCADGQVCDEDLDVCVGCTEHDDCEGDKKCVNGECKCPPTSPLDLGGGRCGQCAGQADCEAKYGKCVRCIDNQCVPITDCADGVCDPATGECEECVGSGDCEGDNKCCVGKKCVCCPGYVYSAATGTCVEAPDCTGDDCGPCGICVLGKCVPRQCPDGKVCVEGECLDKCDCNNPASCTNKGKICKNINGICACVSCGAGCASGCIDGCHCEGTACVVDPCHGECENAAECGTGCGCDEANNGCVQCSQLSCATGECATVLGCECVNQVCTYTGNRCVGNCDTKGDCGKDCTCHNGKCVPCEFFSCATGECSEKEGCICNGSTCDGDEDYECGDTLEITKNDASCDIQGELTKERCCGCPVISVLLDKKNEPVPNNVANYAGTWSLSYKAQLFKGNNIDEANRLDNESNPNIATNEEATSGSLKLSVITSYLGGEPDTVVNLSASASLVGVVEFSPFTIQQMNGKPKSSTESKRVKDVTFVLTAEGFEFPNTCKYGNTEIGRYTVTNNPGFGAVNVQDFLSNTDCRDPLFVWYKSSTGAFADSTRIRTVYVPAASSGSYIDNLPNDESCVNGVKCEESCFHYKLDVDCSCETSKSKYIVFCTPGDFTANIKDNTCGKTVKVTVPPSCHANKNKDFKLFVNNVAVWTGKLYPTSPIINKEYTPADGSAVTSVKLSLVCDAEGECDVIKTFTPANTSNVEPSYACIDGQIFYWFQKGLHTPDFTGVTFRDKNGSNVASVSPLPTGYANGIGFYGESGETYTYTVAFACGNVPGTIKKNCCESFNPEFDVDCAANQVSVTGLKDNVTYYLNFHEVAKNTLATLNLAGSVTFKPVGSANNVTITPTELGWKAPECVSASVAVPSGSCCPNTTFHAEQDGTDASFLVENIYPAVGTDTLYVKVNAGGFGVLTPGTPVTASYGEVKVTIKRNNCEQETILELRSYDDDCDIEESDVVLTEVDCTYKVDIPDDILCRCKDGYFEPTITSVTIVDNKFRVAFDGTFTNIEKEEGAGVLPLVKTGTLSVISIAADFEAAAIYANTNTMGGYVDIPCPSSSTEPVGYSFSHNVTSLGDITALVPEFTWKLCMNWPAGTGVTVSSVQVNNVTYSQLISGVAAGANCWTVSGLKYTGTTALELEVKWTLSNGDIVSDTMYSYVVNTWDNELAGSYTPEAGLCNKCIDVTISVSEAEFNNGCIYEQASKVSYAENEVCPDGTFDEQYWQAIVFAGANTRKTRVDFYENDVIIKTLFTDGDPVYLDGTLPANPDGIEFGKSYKAKVSCDCVQEVDMDLCLNPKVASAFTTCTSGYYSDGSSILTLTYTLNTCYASRTVYLYRADGTLIDTATTSTAGNVTDRTVTLDESMAGLENDFQIYASFDVSCNGSLYHVSRAEVNLTWTITCAGDDSTFDVVFAGSPTIELVSGSGTVAGSSITGVTNADTIEFRGVINSCTSKTYELTYDCTIDPTPSVTATPSRTPSKSIQGSPSITPSRTVTRTRSASVGSDSGIVIASVSVSRTPSRTPSITPTVTVSATSGASPSVTRSITPSPTPTQTVSPSEGASPSVTRSTTPSPTPTRTVSRTESVTVTPTKTPSRTPSSSVCTVNCIEQVTGYYCGNTVYCCGGVQVDDPTHCCNGTPIDPDAGDVCCTYDPS